MLIATIILSLVAIAMTSLDNIIPDEFYSMPPLSHPPQISIAEEGKGNLELENGQRLVRLLAQHGYAYIMNHSIPDHTVARAFEESQKFFGMSQWEKKTFFAISPSGMTEPNDKMLQRPRLRETMGFQVRGKEVFPREGNPVPSLYPALKGLEEEGFRVTRRVLRMVAIGLGLEDVGVLAETTRGVTDPSVDNGSLLRTMMYLGRRKGDLVPLEALRLKAHHDGNLVTLIYENGVGGLEVYNRNGQWETLTPPAGSIILVGGMKLRELSGGILNPALHRVAPPTSLLRSDGFCEVLEDKEGRQSLVHFVQPDESAAKSPPKFPVLKAKQFFSNMMECHE